MQEAIDGWAVARFAWGTLMTLLLGLVAWVWNREVKRVDDIVAEQKKLQNEQITREEFERRFADLNARLDGFEFRQTEARKDLRVEVETNRRETREDFQRLFGKFDDITSEIRSSTGRWPAAKG